jgi:hypothetical protein
MDHQQKRQALQENLRRSYPVDAEPSFGDLLGALDAAERYRQLE